MELDKQHIEMTNLQVKISKMANLIQRLSLENEYLKEKLNGRSENAQILSC